MRKTINLSGWVKNLEDGNVKVVKDMNKNLGGKLDKMLERYGEALRNGRKV